LKQRIKLVFNQLDPAQQCFERISSSYVESSWEAVAGNGTEAIKRIEGAQALLDEASEEATIAHQQWGDALDKAQQANILLDEAESVLRSIIALETSLAAAKQQAPAELQAADDDITKALLYIDAHKADVDADLKDDLRKAENTLSDAREEFAKVEPNYPKVVKLALAANAHADKVYAMAADEYEAAERLRRQAVSSLQSARSSVSQASEYIEDHRHDVGGDAERRLNDAEQALSTAQAANEPNRVIQHARQAERYADEAYEKARRDFRDAEDERDRERRRRQAAASASSFGSSSSWGSSGGSSHHSFGGGSSGSFGSSNRGGGSSGSW